MHSHLEHPTGSQAQQQNLGTRTSQYFNFDRAVWHDCFHKTFDEIKEAGEKPKNRNRKGRGEREDETFAEKVIL